LFSPGKAVLHSAGLTAPQADSCKPVKSSLGLPVNHGKVMIQATSMLLKMEDCLGQRPLM
jgi:hypothetical protein